MNTTALTAATRRRRSPGSRSQSHMSSRRTRAARITNVIRIIVATVLSLTFTAAETANAAISTGVSERSSGPSAGTLSASGLSSPIGSTVGPDHALYVPEGAADRITRINPRTGETSTFASGLPPALVTIGGATIGGAIDVAFKGGTAYVLVTGGHHNRVLHVTLGGDVSELIGFGNIVPTGLAHHGSTVYMGEAGPIPHAPADGKVVAFDMNTLAVREVASGFSLIVDVEFGPDGALYALSQGDSPGNVDPASPALPNSGELLRVTQTAPSPLSSRS